MMNKNDDKVREILMEEPIPQALEPENIAKMLDEKAPAKKRTGIRRTAMRITAGAAACAVICGSAVHFAGQKDTIKKDNPHTEADESENGGGTSVTKPTRPNLGETTKPAADNKEENNNDTPEAKPLVDAPYMNGASDYSEVYDLFKKYAVDKKDYWVEEAEEAPAAANGDDLKGPETSPAGGDGTGSGDDDKNSFSDTYDQEEGVREADIVKTDGEYIYYIYSDENKENRTDAPTLNIAKVKDGKFLETEKKSLKDADAKEAFKDEDIKKDSVSRDVSDMYLYNDMLIVMGNISVYDEQLYGGFACDCYYPYAVGKTASYVSVYTTGLEPELLGTYYQEGGYQDVRIAPDGFMYLVTTYRTGYMYDIDDPDQIKDYIPLYGINEDVSCVSPGCIYLPDDKLEESTAFESTVIGSIDFNKSGSFDVSEVKVLAGFSDKVYCSAENLYVAGGWEDTDITRFSIGDGKISPAASGKVEGRINDQFSMSEYKGYFRIATTKDTNEQEEGTYSWFDEEGKEHFETYTANKRIKRDNRVYVLDLDMNVVGSIEDLGLDESIKSVNFNGDMAYVVTYQQTDPLFAIDLSDPKKPKLLDEFKILGYSTYMQQWQDGELLGFGKAADDRGVEYGLKLTMFDNSDPEDLKALDTYEIGSEEESWIWSEATYERKALLIAPEKNIIGVPFQKTSWSYDYDRTSSKSGFMFFRFEDEEFEHIGTISEKTTGFADDMFRRAVYIDDYVYVLSGNKFISSEISNIKQTDAAKF